MGILSKLFGKPAPLTKEDQRFERDPFLASQHGNTDLLKRLIGQGLDVGQLSEEGATLVHYASSNLHYSTVRLLIEAGLDPKAKDENGNLAEHWSYMSNEIRMGCPSPQAKEFIDWIREFYED